jgi:hypothetical protein
LTSRTAAVTLDAATSAATSALTDAPGSMPAATGFDAATR